MIAFDRYAVAAAVTKQMDYKVAMRHKEVVLEVAALSFADRRRPFLGVLYDEIVRLVSVALYLWEACIFLQAEVGGRQS